MGMQCARHVLRIVAQGHPLRHLPDVQTRLSGTWGVAGRRKPTLTF